MPNGSVPSIKVTGPGGFNQTLTANTTLNDLALGSYTFTPVRVRQSGTIVDQVFASSPKTLNIQSNSNPALEISYALRPGSGQLWVSLVAPDANKGLKAYTPDQLGQNGSPTPAHDGGSTYYGMALDPDGNLWGVNRTLSRVPSTQLGSSGSSDLSIPLSSGSTTVFWGIAFDASGNAWVAAYKQNGVNDNRILMFRKVDLNSASAKPYLSLESPGLDAPLAVAFDASGNLWAVNETGSLVRYNASSLVGSGSVTVDPKCTFLTTGSLIDLAFDKDGNLWVANQSLSEVDKLTASTLRDCNGDANLTPVLALTGSAIQIPFGLALDNGNNLWVANYSPNTLSINLSKISASDLAKAGNQTATAAIKLEVSGTTLYRPVFNPAPPSLPLGQ